MMPVSAFPPADTIRTPQTCTRAYQGRAGGGRLVPAAVLAQGAILARDTGPGAAPIALVAAAGLLAALAWRARGRVPHLDLVLGACAFGGLGMALVSAAVPVRHAAMMHAGVAALLPSAAAMLAVCVPACLWTCAPVCAGSRLRRGVAHATVIAGMLIGMMAAGSLLAPALATLVGAAAGMHLAMVLGMGVGTAAVLPLATMPGLRVREGP